MLSDFRYRSEEITMSTDKPAGPFYKLSVDETRPAPTVPPKVLAAQKPPLRLQQYGENALPQAGQARIAPFLAHFNDVLIYVLLAAALLTAVMGHWVDTLVILGVAVIALIGHIQESNAENRCRAFAICFPAKRW
jgi:magnesium-transporting ATPase (P-type)